MPQINDPFPDPEAFRQAWRDLLDQLPEPERSIAASVASGTHSFRELSDAHGVSRERIRQRFANATRRIQPILTDQPSDPVAHAVNALTGWTETAGLHLTYRLQTKTPTERGLSQLTQQLTRLGAAQPTDQDLVRITATLIPVPKPNPPKLTNFLKDADQALQQHPTGATPQTLMEDLLPKWGNITQQWPRLDLELHIQAQTGIVTEHHSGAYAPGLRLSANRQRDPNLILKYMVQALHQAQHPLDVEELANGATQAAQQGGQTHTYTIDQVRRTINDTRRFKWAGYNTYALAEWDTGITAPSQKLGRRAQIADEIAHAIRENGSPMSMEAITALINTRFRVSANAVQVSIRHHAKKHFQILPDGTVDLADRPPRKPPCSASSPRPSSKR